MNALIAALEAKLALLKEKGEQAAEELEAEAIKVKDEVEAALDALLAKL